MSCDPCEALPCARKCTWIPAAEEGAGDDGAVPGFSQARPFVLDSRRKKQLARRAGTPLGLLVRGDIVHSPLWLGTTCQVALLSLPSMAPLRCAPRFYFYALKANFFVCPWGYGYESSTAFSGTEPC